jgi:hypothetical protein
MINLCPLDAFLDKLSSEIPNILCDKDLIQALPEIFKSPSSLTRMRAHGQAPAHFAINKTCIRYLKSDVLSWLRKHYNSQEVK